MKKDLPEKTVERLSQYRRVLIDWLAQNNYHIYSHEIAGLLHITPEQVRRDLMLIGYSTTLKKGYDVKKLIDVIEEILDHPEGLNVTVIGMGNLGTAITTYYRQKRKKLNIVATFDTDPNKINRVIAGVRCYHVEKLKELIKELDISIAILTLPIEFTKDISEKLILYGIKGILNYTTCSINVPNNIYLEEYDMVRSIEKLAYFVKQSNN